MKDYNSLSYGNYRFYVRAELPGGPGTEASYAFVVLRHFYETTWFRLAFLVMLLASARA